ncbi:hypothetical protein CC2G_002075 [Coprinopsis cinerea AmutBmut pab1-1]|nr:hypothetical protein CC2G_002075 [Coprinopsis cinerea AmutBmut pab1-1]
MQCYSLLRRRLFLTKTTNLFKTETNDPTWRLVSLLNRSQNVQNVPRYALTQHLKTARIPLEEYRYWEAQIHQIPRETVPPWVALHLLSSRQFSAAEAYDPLLDLVILNLPSLPEYLQSQILVLSAVHLASWGMAIPLRDLVDEFVKLGLVKTPVYPNLQAEPTLQHLVLDSNQSYDLYSNLFLRALSHIPAYSPPYHDSITSVFSQMTSNSFQANPETYSYLLGCSTSTSPPHTPSSYSAPLSIPLLDFLRTQMAISNITPLPEHNAAFKTFWTNLSKRVQSKDLSKISSRTRTRRPSVSRYPTRQRKAMPEDKTGNMPYQEAFSKLEREEFFTNVLKDEKSPLDPFWMEAEAEEVVEMENDAGDWEDGYQAQFAFLNDPALPVLNPAKVRTARSYIRLWERIVKRRRERRMPTLFPSGDTSITPHVKTNYELTQPLIRLLKVAAEDLSLDSGAFVALFRRLTVSPIFPPPESDARLPQFTRETRVLQPTLRSYVLLLRGLVLRKDWEQADRIWTFLYESGGFDFTLGDSTRYDFLPAVWQAGDSCLDGTTLKHREDEEEFIGIGLQLLNHQGLVRKSWEVLDAFVSYRRSTMPLEDPSPWISTSLLNTYLTSLRRASSPISISGEPEPINTFQLIFTVFDHSYILFRVLPDVTTLNIVLQTAKDVRTWSEGSIRGQIAKIWKGFTTRKQAPQAAGWKLPRDSPSQEEAEQTTGQEIKRLLDHGASASSRPLTKAMTANATFWRSRRPEDTARDVFLQVMFGMGLAARPSSSYPTTDGAKPEGPLVLLTSIQSPARSVRESWDSAGGIVGLGVALPSLKLESFRWENRIRSGKGIWRWPAPPTSPTQASLPRTPRAYFPHLPLADSSLFDYLSLLATTPRTTEIPLLFAWAKYLGVRPSESTVALALVLWGEVSAESPLVEGLVKVGGRDRKANTGAINPSPEGEIDGGDEAKISSTTRNIDEYTRFVLWLEDWLGVRQIPNERTLAKWRLIVKKMRMEGFPTTIV